MRPLLPNAARQLTDFGERLRKARLRRKLTAETISTRAGISRVTLHRIESGDATVAFGHYFQVLIALQLGKDLDKLAADDVLGRRLQDLELPERRRAPKRLKTVSDAREVP